MKYKLTIDQASISNIVRGLMESYEGTDFVVDLRETIKNIINEKYFAEYGKKSGNRIINELSIRYGLSKSYIKRAIYGSNNRQR